MVVLLNSLYKGGIGKTSNSVILTHILADKGYKILFIDCDPQGNGTRFLTTKSTTDVEFQKKNIFEAVKHDELKDNILKLKENIDYVPGNENINLFERMMDRKKSPQIKGIFISICYCSHYRKRKCMILSFWMSVLLNLYSTHLLWRG